MEVITSLKGKRAVRCEAPRALSPEPRSIFNRYLHSQIVYVSPRWNLSGFRSLGSLTASSSSSSSSSFSYSPWSPLLRLSSSRPPPTSTFLPLVSDLVRLPFSRVHPSNRPGNYIWVLIKRTSWTGTARSWFSPLAHAEELAAITTVTPSAVINLLETPG